MDVREHLARIDRVIASGYRDRDASGPVALWKAFVILLAAGAVFFVAGAAFIKILG